MGISSSFLYGVGQLAPSILESVTNLYDRYRISNDPALNEIQQILGNIYNNAVQNNPYGTPSGGWDTMFGGQGYGQNYAQSLVNMMNLNPNLGIAQSYQQMAGMQAPTMVDSSAGLAGLLGMQGAGGYTPQSFIPSYTDMNQGSFEAANSGLDYSGGYKPVLSAASLASLGSGGVASRIGNRGLLSRLFGGGSSSGGLLSGLSSASASNPLPQLPSVSGSSTPGVIGSTLRWLPGHGKIGAKSMEPSLSGEQTQAQTQTQGATQSQGAASPNLLSVLFSNPTSMPQRIQDMLYQQGANVASQQAANQARSLRNAMPTGGLAGGAAQRGFQDIQSGLAQQLSNLRANIGAMAAQQNQQDLLQAAQMQSAAYQAAAQQIAAQNAQNLAAYQNQFNNQGTITSALQQLQSGAMNQNLQLNDVLNALAQQGTQYPSSALSDVFSAHASMLAPGSVASGSYTDASGGSGSQSGGGNSLAYAAGALLGNYMGGY